MPTLRYERAARLWVVGYTDPELGLCRCYFATRRAAERALPRARKLEAPRAEKQAHNKRA